jgi:hypothetical protein
VRFVIFVVNPLCGFCASLRSYEFQHSAVRDNRPYLTFVLLVVNPLCGYS